MKGEDRMADSPVRSNPVVPARLKKRRDFLYAAGGRKGHSALFTVQARARTDADDGPRVGLTVTKKVGNAVERNRIKRRLRETLRLAGGLHLTLSHDYVIVARRPLLSVPFCEIGRGLRMTVAKTRDGGRTKDRVPRS